MTNSYKGFVNWNEEFANNKDYVPKTRDWLGAFRLRFKSPKQISRLRNTGIKLEILKRVGKTITTLSETFKPQRAMKRIYDQRAQMIETGLGLAHEKIT